MGVCWRICLGWLSFGLNVPLGLSCINGLFSFHWQTAVHKSRTQTWHVPLANLEQVHSVTSQQHGPFSRIGLQRSVLERHLPQIILSPRRV